MLAHICFMCIYLIGCLVHIMWFSCRQAGKQARPSPEVVNHLLWRRLIGYYLCCQKQSRASTSPHQSLSVHMLPVDGATEHEAACYHYPHLETRVASAHNSITSSPCISFVKAGIHLHNCPFWYV